MSGDQSIGVIYLLSYCLALLLGYLLGSIPFGLLLTRAAGLGDVRKIGSGNIGATNVLRTGNKGLAAATLLLDAFKGTAAVLIAGHFGLGIWAGFAALIGHLFPIWLGFKGGKGVATYLGVLIGIAINLSVFGAIAWLPALAFALVWLSVAWLFRYSSLAALVSMVAVPVTLYAIGWHSLAGWFALMSILIFFKHRANISRLLAGTETKIGAKG